MKKVTMADVARLAQVDKSIVSIIINNHAKAKRVSEATKQRVLSAVAELNYRPNYLARAMTSKKSYSIGFVTGDVSVPFFADLTNALMLEAQRHGYQLLVAATGWDEEKELDAMNFLLDRQVDGLITFAKVPEPGSDLYNRIQQEKVPFIYLSEKACWCSSVGTDWKPGMHEAVALYKKNGHKDIVFIHQKNIPYSEDEKAKAFINICQQLEMNYQLKPCGLTLEDGISCGIDLAESGSSKAVICYSDYNVIGIINGLKQKGMNVPDDIEIIGTDGIEMGRYFIPSICSIYNDREKRAKLAVEMVLEMLEKKEGFLKQILLPSYLIPGKSVKK